MYRKYAVKNPQAENRVFFSRVIAISVLIMTLTLVMVVRLVYLQIVGHEHYASRAKENRIKLAPLPPTRGIIYDREGRVLAENLPAYNLELVPEQIDDLDDTLARLQRLLAIPDEQIERFQKQLKRQKPFSSTPLLLRMSDEKVARFATVRQYFPGVDIQARLLRYYPYGALTSHVIGYVGRINERELKSLPESEYRGTDHIGKIGIEKTYEHALHGTTGYAEIETNAQGRSINSRDALEPVPGSDLYLTLDIDLQKTAYEAFGQYNGAAVAIEVKTGDVLVFASRPGFDPNPFVYGISSRAYNALKESDAQPLFNRALRGQYPPGSTIKPFIALAGLEDNVTDTRHKLYCPGYYQLPKVRHRFRDWKKQGHGWVNLHDAIVQSCDVYFYDLALTLGIDKMHEFLGKFGFGRKTGIDLYGEQSGLLPSREWKKRARNENWYHGETLITGIGQGFTQVTPLQLAKATAVLANRGISMTPVLVDKIISSSFEVSEPEQDIETVALKKQHLDDVMSAMIDVVHGPRGTAKRISTGIDFKIAGKTGTAQVYTVKQEENYNEHEIAEKLRDHALFVAFAPASDPQIAVAVVVENGGHGGSVAAPIASKIINQYLGVPQVEVDSKKVIAGEE